MKAKERREKDELARQQADADLAALMSTATGRRFMWWLLDGVCGINSGSFVGDSHATAYNEGMRAVGIRVLQEVQRVAEGDYVHMLKEQLDARRREEPEGPTPGHRVETTE